MVTCDYLIIGSGFAGIGLKYKLLGRTIMIDPTPYRYKIGESHIPILVNGDPGLFSLVPKIMTMKSYTRKLGTIFCDSYHGQYASNFPTSLGTSFAWHCEREEIEKLLTKELSIEIQQETILDINLEKSIVKTDQNTYRFTKYLLDCTGPAMVIANQLNLVSPVGKFAGMKAQWSYWAIDTINKDVDSWAQWTVINKIGIDSWTWQIPLYNSSILSMGLLHRQEPLSDNDFIKYIKKYTAQCYRLSSIAANPEKAIKPYMKKIHSRMHYSKVSRQCSGKNWILVGDAYCFADPVYSVGSGVAMLEAITIADNLNKNNGKFDHAWYTKNCNALLKTVIDGIGTWYSGDAFNKETNKEVNTTILQGGFSRHFRPSSFTEKAKQWQNESIDAFLPSAQHFFGSYLKYGIKVYNFDRNSFVKLKNSLSLLNHAKSVRINNSAVAKAFINHVIGKKLSFPDLYLIAELNLQTLADKAYFWKIIQLIELASSSKTATDRLFYFHPEKYERIHATLKLGDAVHSLIFNDPTTILFFEKLKGKILFGKEIIAQAKKISDATPTMQKNIETFLKIFFIPTTFGQYFSLTKK